MAAADSTLADALGLPADVVAKHRSRHLTEGVHYTRAAESGRIDYTDAGLSAIAQALCPAEKKEKGPPAPAPTSSNTAATPPPAQAPKKKEMAAPPQPGKPVLCRLLRQYPNPLFADVLADGKREMIRVRNNTLLDVRKRLLCRKWPDGRWECVQGAQAVKLKPLPPTAEA